MKNQYLFQLSSYSVFSILLGFICFVFAMMPVQAQQNFQDSFNPELDMGVFSVEAIDLRGSARILGSVATNSTQSSSVLLNSWANPNSIDGNLSIGTGGNPSTVISSVNPNSVGGSILNLTSARSYPLPDFPDFPAKDVTGNSISLSGNASQTITPADFSGKYISSIRIRNNTNLTIDLDGGHHVLHVGDLQVEQGHIQFVNAGSLIILVENDLVVGGSSSINQNGSTEHLFLFYDGSGEVNFAGNTRFMGSLFASQANVRIGGSNGIMGHVITGGSEVTISGNASAISRVVYAPNAQMDMTGSASVRGAIVTKTFTGTGNIRVYYEGGLKLNIPDLSAGTPPVLATVQGSVLNDINGLTNNDVDGNPLSQIDDQPLHVSLIDQSNQVANAQAVQANGYFSFDDVPVGDFSVMLSIQAGTVGQPAPSKELTGLWMYISDRAGAGEPAENNIGSVNLSVGTDDIQGIEFGIQQRPKAYPSNLPSEENPGSDHQITIPSNAFTGDDADGGFITAIRIPTFPLGIESLFVDGNSFTQATFPANGIIIPTNPTGNPSITLEVTPVDGDTDVQIPFFTIDNAQAESTNQALISLPLTAGASSPVVNTFPATGYATLAFEDSWPGKGDYDFNDVVVDFQFTIDSNTSNFVDRVTGKFILRAFGAGYQNGFGFQLAGSIQASDITVSGYSLTENYITLNPNGTEAGQSRPTIIVFDNAYNEMNHPGTGVGVNTERSAPFVEPKTYTIIIELPANTYTFDDIRISQFNPFIIVDMTRGREVHLPGFAPTNLADPSYFGQLDDDTNPAQGRTYVSSNNLPWGIMTYEQFDYPIEFQDITLVYLRFIEWAESGGTLFPDWYKDINGYRNRALIYRE